MYIQEESSEMDEEGESTNPTQDKGKEKEWDKEKEENSESIHPS